MRQLRNVRKEIKLEFKKFIIYAGNYGSGKTELSINTALKMAASNKRTILVDMDIVNPYFRSSEHEEMLTRQGIRVVKPCFANTMVDVPSLPAEIFTPFDSPIDHGIYDAGGDPVGAAALGQLSEKFAEVWEDTEFLYVINTFRPLQETAESVAEMLRQIEGTSKMKVTGLVNNANIAVYTEPDMVRQGQEIVEQVSRITGIPQKFTSILEKNAQLVTWGEVYPINLYMRPDWLDL